MSGFDFILKKLNLISLFSILIKPSLTGFQSMKSNEQFFQIKSLFDLNLKEFAWLLKKNTIKNLLFVQFLFNLKLKMQFNSVLQQICRLSK